MGHILNAWMTENAHTSHASLDGVFYARLDHIFTLKWVQSFIVHVQVGNEFYSYFFQIFFFLYDTDMRFVLIKILKVKYTLYLAASFFSLFVS